MLRRIAAWLLAAVWVAWAAVRTTGLEVGYPLVPLIAYTPVAVVGAGVTVLLALVLRARRAALAALAATLVLGAGVLPRAVDDGEAATPPRLPLRVLTANVHAGATPPSALRRLVRRYRVDVLSVQELTPGLDEALRDVLPHAVVRPRPGSTGTGLYARLPLSPLPGPEGTDSAITVAALRLASGRELEVHAVHPRAPAQAHHIPIWRAELRAQPPARRGTRGRLRLLAGDFNATLDHIELRRVLGTGYVDAAERAGAGLRPTWNRGRLLPPPVTIDHVLIDERCEVASARVLNLARSDHEAVFAELDLAPCLARRR